MLIVGKGLLGTSVAHLICILIEVFKTLVEKLIMGVSSETREGDRLEHP